MPTRADEIDGDTRKVLALRDAKLLAGLAAHALTEAAEVLATEDDLRREAELAGQAGRRVRARLSTAIAQRLPDADREILADPNLWGQAIDGLDRLQMEVGDWGAVTFPSATLESITAHLMEEAEELNADCTVQGPEEGMASRDEIKMEAADCLLLLMHVAYREGFSLIEAAREKLIVNKGRTWAPAEGGYWKHE